MYEQQILNLIKKESPQNPLAYVQNIVRSYASDNLREVMLADRECNADAFRTTFSGNIEAEILVLNDRPRPGQSSIHSMADSDELELLSKVFEHFDYNPQDAFYIDAVNCLTYKEVQGEKIVRAPSRQEIEACRVFVDHAIDIVRPKVILLLGPIASGMYQNEAFMSIRGEVVLTKGIQSIVTYNPEKLLNRQGQIDEHSLSDMKEEFVQDIESLLTILKN